MKKWWWAVIAGVVVIVIVGAFLLTARARAAKAGATATYTAQRVTRSALTISISTTGEVSPLDTLQLAPSASGKITALLVDVGDHVRSGQILARLDDSDARAKLRSSQEALTAAVAKRQAAEEQAALNPTQTAMQLAQARAAVASASAKLNALKAGPTDSELTAAKAALNQAQLNLASAKADYERTQRLYDQGAATKQQLTDANNKYLTSQDSLTSAQAKMADLQAPPNADELAAAEASLVQAQAQLTIAQANAETTSTDDTLASARAAEQDARANLSDAAKGAAGMVITAPTEGVIAAVSGTAGAYVQGNSPLITLAAIDQLIVKADVDENDIAQIKTGMKAQITIDALPDAEFTGQVLSVGELGTVQNGVVNFPVRISVDDPERLVKAGMTANADIIVAESPNALAVPNSAVETRMGRTVVRIFVSDKEATYRRVTVGLRTDTATEIVEGLREGDQVAITGIKATSGTSSGTNNPGGGMGVFGSMRVGGGRN